MLRRIINHMAMATEMHCTRARFDGVMKFPVKFGLSTVLGAGLLLFAPSATFAQRGGGGGNQRGGSQRSGGQSFSGQRGGQAQRGSVQRGPTQQSSGRQSFSNQQRFSGSNQQRFSGSVRGFSNRAPVRRGGFSYYSAPYRSYYGFSGYYAPTYCNPNGFYDQWGNWFPDPNCGYDPYYYGY